MTFPNGVLIDFPPRAAVLILTAGAPQPRVAEHIADCDVRDTVAHLDDVANSSELSAGTLPTGPRTPSIDETSLLVGSLLLGCAHGLGGH